MKPLALAPRVSWCHVLPLLAAATLAGCSRSGQAPSGGPGRVKAALVEPSAADRLAFAQDVVAAFDAQDRAKVDALIDWSTLFDIGTEDLGLPEKDRNGLFASFQKTVSSEQGLGALTIAASAEGARLRFLGERKREGKTVLLFRLTYPIDQRGVAYYEYLPRRCSDGKVRAADIYDYLAGEFSSETFRRIMLPIIADRSRTIFDRLVTGEQDFVQDLPRTAQAFRLLREGKRAEAQAIFKALRPGTLKHKAVLLGRLEAVEDTDEKEYIAVMDDLQKLFPNDPCLDMIAIDARLLRKDYAGALKAIDRLDRAVGGDPYLDLMRASVHELQEDDKGALECVRRAIEREPTLLDAHQVLLGIQLDQRDHVGALAEMKTLHQEFDIPFDDLADDEDFADFVKSPKYADWLAYLKSEARPAAPKPAGADAKKK